jgi:hypothetical protein
MTAVAIAVGIAAVLFLARWWDRLVAADERDAADREAAYRQELARYDTDTDSYYDLPPWWEE